MTTTIGLAHVHTASLETDMARSFAQNFDADALRQIAKAAQERADWLTTEAQGVHRLDGVRAALPFLHDARAFADLAAHCANIANEVD
jgi:hypothetical protein